MVAPEVSTDFPKDTTSVTKGSVSPTPVPTPTSPAPQILSHHNKISITPDSIQQIPPYRPRKSKEWMPVEVKTFCTQQNH